MVSEQTFILHQRALEWSPSQQTASAVQTGDTEVTTTELTLTVQRKTQIQSLYRAVKLELGVYTVGGRKLQYALSILQENC